MTTPTWLDPVAWPWAPRSFEGEDGHLHYVDEGQGQPVLFSHGTPTWSFEWRHAIRALSPDARCIAVDHLGFGLSERPNTADYAPEAHARRFASFADSLDLHDATVVIHDFGGPIALPWVLDNLSRVRRLVIVNTWAWSLADEPRFATPARLFATSVGRWLYGALNVSLDVLAASAWADRKAWRAVRGNYRPNFPTYASRVQVLWPLANALLASSDFYASLEARLPELANTPVDVVWGVKDPAFPTEVRDRWLRHVPHAESLDLPAGHWPHEESPAGFVEYLAQHLRAAA